MSLDAIVIQICYARKAYACQCKQVEENEVLSLRNIQLASSVVGWNNGTPSCMISLLFPLICLLKNMKVSPKFGKKEKIYNKHRTGQGNCTKAILQDTRFIEHVNIQSHFKRQNRWTHWPELRKKISGFQVQVAYLDVMISAKTQWKRTQVVGSMSILKEGSA